MSSRPSALKRPRAESTVGKTKGGNHLVKGKGGGKSDDDQDEVSKERNYHWCPDDTEIGSWLRQQVATKGNEKFSKQRVDGSYRAQELGNVTMLEYRSKLPMSSQRPRPNKLYIPYCTKNVAGAGYTEESNPFLEAWP